MDTERLPCFQTLLILLTISAILITATIMKAPFDPDEPKRKQAARRLHYLGMFLKMAGFILMLPCFLCLFAYKSNWLISQRFYAGMLGDVRFRKIYERLLFFDCCIIHFIWLMLDGNPIYCIISTALMCIFLNERLCHRLLMSLSEKRWMFPAMLVSLAALFTDGMYPVALTIYIFIVASAFYPSRKAFGKFQQYESYEYYRQFPEDLRDIYY